MTPILSDSILKTMIDHKGTMSFNDLNNAIQKLNIGDLTKTIYEVNQLVANGFLSESYKSVYTITDKGFKAAEVGIEKYKADEKRKEQAQIDLNEQMIQSIKDQKKDRKYNRLTTAIIILLTLITAIIALITFLKPLLTVTA